MLTESPRYGRADSNINSLRLRQHAQVLYKFKPNKTSVWRRGRHKFHPQSTSYLQLIPAGRWKINFFQWSLTGSQSHSTASPMTRNGWPTHIRLHLKMLLVFCFILISFVVVFLIFLFPLTFFIFLMFFRSRGRRVIDRT